MKRIKYGILCLPLCLLLSLFPCTGVKAAADYSYNITARELTPTKYPLDNSSLNVPIRGGSSVSGTFEFEYNISGYEKFIDVYHEYSFGLSLDDVPRFIFDMQVNLPVGDVVTTTSMYLVCNGVEYPFTKNSGNNWSAVLSDGVFNSVSLKFKVNYLATYGGADTNVFYMSNPRLVVSNGTLSIYDSSTLTDQGEVNSFRSRMEEMIGGLSSSIGKLNSDLQSKIQSHATTMVNQFNSLIIRVERVQSELQTQFSTLFSEIDAFQVSMETWAETLDDTLREKFNFLVQRMEFQFSALFEKMDEQQNEIINGYDPATGDNANDEFENITDDLSGTEENLFNLTENDFSFNQSDLVSDQGFLAAASFVGTFMQGIFEASGLFGSVAMIGLVLLVFTRLIGFQNFAGGDG